MILWIEWCKQLLVFRKAFSRERTFMWFCVAITGIAVRSDLAGVTSIIRALGLKDFCYDRLREMFHSNAFKVDKLANIWYEISLKIFNPHMVNGRIVMIGDGIKVSKEGKKMPAVKSLHQDSQSNSKANYIMGHSYQVMALLVESFGYFFAVPIVGRIHEGIVLSNRDKRTLLDKMLRLFDSVKIDVPCYLVADAYYAAGKVIKGLLSRGHHLIARVRSNAIAYLPFSGKQKKRGRKKIYGKKIKLRTVFNNEELMIEADSPVYGEKNIVILYRVMDLLWRPVGHLVRFVFVKHPTRGRIIFISTDLELEALEIIRIYGLRFKIEVSFKQAIHTLGTYLYHFWMKHMAPIKRTSGDQHLHHKSKEYRNAVAKKINAYHTFVQTGIVAQGLLQYLSIAFTQSVWKCFGSWLRTVRPGILPSEQVVGMALRNSLPEFLSNSSHNSNLKKFIRERLDLSRAEGLRLAG